MRKIYVHLYNTSDLACENHFQDNRFMYVRLYLDNIFHRNRGAPEMFAEFTLSEHTLR